MYLTLGSEVDIIVLQDVMLRVVVKGLNMSKITRAFMSSSFGFTSCLDMFYDLNWSFP